MPFIDAGEMTSAEPLPGWAGRFLHSENMTFAIYEVDADAAPIHEHHHPQEEVWPGSQRLTRSALRSERNA
jgi:hypothetical protein